MAGDLIVAALILLPAVPAYFLGYQQCEHKWLEAEHMRLLKRSHGIEEDE